MGDAGRFSIGSDAVAGRIYSHHFHFSKLWSELCTALCAPRFLYCKSVLRRKRRGCYECTPGMLRPVSSTFNIFLYDFCGVISLSLMFAWLQQAAPVGCFAFWCATLN